MTTATLLRPHGTTILHFLLLSLVALADILFYGHPTGWTVGLFAAALALALFVRSGRNLKAGPGLVLLLGVAGLALAAVEEPGSIVSLMLPLGVVSLALVSRGGWTSSISAWFERWFVFFVSGWMQWLIDRRRMSRRARQVSGRPSVAARLVRQWSIPLALGLVFVAIFWFANPVIAILLDSLKTFVGERLMELPDLLSPLRVLFWLFVGVWVWALLRSRPVKARTRAEVVPDADMRLDALITPALVVRCLLVFNLIFAAQTLLDVRYLLLGGGLPEGVSLKTYAHQGAYPLIAASLLAAAFVVVTFRQNGPAQRSPVARKLVYLWLVQNAFLVLTAALRLKMYVDFYGLTRWRVAAFLWMLLVAVGIVLIISRIVQRRSNAWLIRANSLAALMMIYTCAPIDFDGLISTFNVRHCSEAGDAEKSPVDLGYLRHQGPEALPAIDELLVRMGNENSERRTRACAIRDELREELRWMMRDWRGWTWRRQRLLDKLPAEALVAPLVAPAHASWGRSRWSVSEEQIPPAPEPAMR